MLKGKTVLLGVTGSIAAYKIAYLASALKKLHAQVHVLMTKNATNFINPITFETLTGNKCLVDTFDRNFQFSVEHVSIAKQADVVMIAPASANVIGKLAHGIADDMLTTTIMACKCKKIVSPAMNTNMYENPIVQDNLAILQHYGYEVIEPASGYLACGDTGAGKMPEPEMLLDYILREPPPFVKLVPVVTAKEMFDAVTSVSFEQDIIIKAAAVADYRPANVYEDKVKKQEEQMSIELEKTDDILGYLGEHKPDGQFLCGFSMETENMIGNSRVKLTRKNLDMVAANNVKMAGAGFQGDTNVLTLITQDEDVSLQLMSKEDAANVILDKILSIQKEREKQ